MAMAKHAVDVDIDESSSDEENPVVARRSLSGADGSTISVIDAWKAWNI